MTDDLRALVQRLRTDHGTDTFRDFCKCVHCDAMRAANELESLLARAEAAEAAIAKHNNDCVGGCVIRREYGHCKGYVERGRQCPDCPKDWVIDIAIAEGKHEA